MNYESWLEAIEKLRQSNVNKELLETLKKEEINQNINEMLVPKLEALVIFKLEKTLTKIKNDLENIFSDLNYLDLVLVNFKKEIMFLIEIAKLKQIPYEIGKTITDKIKESANNTFDILIKEANNIDITGILAITIKNNRIKWSD